MAAIMGRSLLITLLFCQIISCCRGASASCFSNVSENVHRYAKQHYRRNWETQVDEIEPRSNLGSATFVYLPHEVILMKQAVSKEKQMQLFSRFVPFLTTDKEKVDQSLCTEDKCTLFTFKMTDQKEETLQKLGSTLFVETAEQLANFQKVKQDDYIEKNLKLTVERAPRFAAVHGVWYNESGYLRSHRDRTWDQANSTSQTEWVLSISLGAAAYFTYHHPKDEKQQHSTSVLVESGDVLLFSGAYLYHGVRVLEHSIPKWWEKQLGNLQGRLNLQYRVLIGEGRQKDNEQPTSCQKKHEDKPCSDTNNQPYLRSVEDKPSSELNNINQPYLMRAEDKPCSETNSQPYLMRVEDKPNRDTKWLMRVEDKPSRDTINQPYLMRVEDKPSSDTINQPYLMRVEDKPSSDSINQTYLRSVEDKPSSDIINQPYLMRVEDKPSSDTKWLMRVEDKPCSDTINQPYLMRVEDKPSSDTKWLMRVEDKPCSDTINQPYLMRVEDKPSSDINNQPYLMRVEDKPSSDTKWLMRVEDKPSSDSINQPYLMRVEDKPSSDTKWLMRVEDKPCSDTISQPYLMRVEDKPSSDINNQPYLMRVEDKPSSDTKWLMRVEDKPCSDTINQPYLMRVEDKPSSDINNQPYLMRGEDKPSSDTINQPYLMRVEDKPSSDTSSQPYLMRVEDKPNSDTSNQPYLMRVEDKPCSDTSNQPYLMRVEDKPCSDTCNQPYLMRVEDKPCSDTINQPYLMRVEDKPSRETNSQPYLMKVEDKLQRGCERLSWLPLLKEDVNETAGIQRDPNAPAKVVPYLALTKNLFKQFWCFNYTINREHQKRAIVALGGNGNTSDVKASFYEALKSIQGLNIPVKNNEIVVSFEDSNVVESMYKAGLLENPKKFISNGEHLFSKKEQQYIRKKTAQALTFIRQADRVLYDSLLQVVACIGYYKASERGHLGGTVSSAIGLIWLDPSKGGDWSIPFLAEQIVHEYIHTTLFIAEMVRGMYTDTTLVPTSLVVSAIRRQKRGYDKSFHAAYVATGLVAFHAHTGSIGRATELGKYLNQSVYDLEKVHLETGILDETGIGMLLHLKTFLLKAKLM